MNVNRKPFPVVNTSTCVLFLTALMLAGLSFSCRNTIDESDRSENYPATKTKETVSVETVVVEQDAFYKQLHSNGRLRAKQKLKLVIPASEQIMDVRVRNGDRVIEGQVLAVLCNKRVNSRLARANLQLKRAVMDMEDILLGQGFVMQDSLNIPDFTWQMAGIRSGYFEVLNETRDIEREVQQTLIRAPFDGLVANLQMQANEMAKPGDIFCSLIDQSEFLVSFHLMEQELALAEGSDISVIISPFSRPDKNHKGFVQSINPVVDEFGQVELTAVIPGTPGLLEGLHANVRIQKKIQGQIAVPRSAVLSRDGHDVLFKYLHGKAVWTYINVLHKNSTSYSVIADPNRVASLEPGDTIIISNNLHLAHDSPVKRKNE